MREWGFEMIWKSCGKQLWMSIKSNLYNLIIMIWFYLAPCCSNSQWSKRRVVGAFPTLQQNIQYFMPLTTAIYLGKGGCREIILHLMNHNPKPLQVTKYFFGAWLPWNDAAQKNYCGFQQNKRDMYGHPWWENIVFHHSWHVRIGVSWWGFASIGRLFALAFSLSLISS